MARDAGQRLAPAAKELLQRAATKQVPPSFTDEKLAPTAEEVAQDMGAASAAVGELIGTGEQLAGVFEQVRGVCYRIA